MLSLQSSWEAASKNVGIYFKTYSCLFKNFQHWFIIIIIIYIHRRMHSFKEKVLSWKDAIIKKMKYLWTLKLLATSLVRKYCMYVCMYVYTYVCMYDQMACNWMLQSSQSCLLVHHHQPCSPAYWWSEIIQGISGVSSNQSLLFVFFFCSRASKISRCARQSWLLWNG